MRYVVAILVMLMLVNVLGCKNPEAAQPNVVDEIENEANGQEVDEGIWLTDYEQALSVAKEHDLPVLINFSGSDWCGWCIKLMDEVFDKEEFKAYAKENLVLLNLDFPKQSKQSKEVQAANQALAERYGVKGFPTVILLNSKGEVIGQTGYRDGGPKPYVEHLKQMIK
jgi:protein disulfide-isomerase